MDDIKFENLLGKPITVFEETIGDNFENTLFKKDFYYILDENIRKDFYGVPYNCLSISTDEKNNNIQSITIHFKKTIGRNFYDTFIENYGLPQSILVIENRQIISKDTISDNDITQHLTKSSFDLREGTFEENPLYIIWTKENYQIKAFLRHKQNISEITFSVINSE